MSRYYCLYHRDPDYASSVGDPLLMVVPARHLREALRKAEHLDAPTGLLAIPLPQKRLYRLYHKDPDYAASVGDPLVGMVRATSRGEALQKAQGLFAPTGLIPLEQEMDPEAETWPWRTA